MSNSRNNPNYKNNSKNRNNLNINVNMSDINTVRDISFYSNNIVNNSQEPNLEKLSLHMDFYKGHKGFNYYEKIYFLIFFDLFNYNSKSDNPSYGTYSLDTFIRSHLSRGWLSEEELKSICLLILKKLSQDYFFEITTSEKPEDFELVKKNIYNLIVIFYQLDEKYWKTFRHLKKLIRGFIKKNIEPINQSYYEGKINDYLDFIRYLFFERIQIINIPDNANSSYSFQGKIMDCSKFPCRPFPPKPSIIKQKRKKGNNNNNNNNNRSKRGKGNNNK
jgi:hypothetical protein